MDLGLDIWVPYEEEFADLLIPNLPSRFRVNVNDTLKPDTSVAVLVANIDRPEVPAEATALLKRPPLLRPKIIAVSKRHDFDSARTAVDLKAHAYFHFDPESVPEITAHIQALVLAWAIHARWLYRCYREFFRDSSGKQGGEAGLLKELFGACVNTPGFLYQDYGQGDQTLLIGPWSVDNYMSFADFDAVGILTNLEKDESGCIHQDHGEHKTLYYLDLMRRGNFHFRLAFLNPLLPKLPNFGDHLHKAMVKHLPGSLFAAVRELEMLSSAWVTGNLENFNNSAEALAHELEAALEDPETRDGRLGKLARTLSYRSKFCERLQEKGPQSVMPLPHEHPELDVGYLWKQGNPKQDGEFRYSGNRQIPAIPVLAGAVVEVIRFFTWLAREDGKKPVIELTVTKETRRFLVIVTGIGKPRSAMKRLRWWSTVLAEEADFQIFEMHMALRKVGGRIRDIPHKSGNSFEIIIPQHDDFLEELPPGSWKALS
ncbi:MAG: hypothetical protein QNK37_23575 [Acidobacteriota bacterium]|nr:hypothetical protein [Acidobacteriota bacterium]